MGRNRNRATWVVVGSSMKNYHYTRTLPMPERFWAKVIKTDSCWLWDAAKADGYGVFNHPDKAGSHHRAHRIAYEMLVGPIPADKELDHLCHERSCVNPKHLEPVTTGENIRRIKRPIECPQGHREWTTTKQGWRKCKACHREREALRRKERRNR